MAHDFLYEGCRCLRAQCEKVGIFEFETEGGVEGAGGLAGGTGGELQGDGGVLSADFEEMCHELPPEVLSAIFGVYDHVFHAGFCAQRRGEKAQCGRAYDVSF